MRKLCLFAMLAVCGLILAISPASAKTWESDEPPGLEKQAGYPDGSPDPATYGHPCEIVQMLVDDNVGGSAQKFSYTIKTMFGNTLSRTTSAGWADSYWSGVSLRQFSAGDLYIRVRSKENLQAVKGVYGLALEQHTTFANTEMNHIYGQNTLAVVAGKLYEDVLFATGTYETYADHFAEMPDMATDAYKLWLSGSGLAAEPLPGAIHYFGTPSSPAAWNRYPTLLLDGDAVAPLTYEASTPLWTKEVGWVPIIDPDKTTRNYQYGTWTGDLTLPTSIYNADTDYLEFWWSMQCGNDAVMVRTTSLSDPSGGVIPIPLPGSLLLCGIGVGFSALVSVVRRRSRKA